MKKIILTLLFSFLATAAYAQENSPESFKDWLTVSDLLRTKGIEPSSPNWGTITPMCLPLKTTTDQVAYNQCLYEKAMDEYQWPIDNKFCDDRSKEKYPDSMMTSGRIVQYVGDDGSLLTGSAGLYGSWGQLQGDRKGSYQDCMAEKNWNDIDNWIAGRSDKNTVH